jgi:hypothetical protein
MLLNQGQVQFQFVVHALLVFYCLIQSHNGLSRMKLSNNVYNIFSLLREQNIAL